MSFHQSVFIVCELIQKLNGQFSQYHKKTDSSEAEKFLLMRHEGCNMALEMHCPCQIATEALFKMTANNLIQNTTDCNNILAYESNSYLLPSFKKKGAKKTERPRDRPTLRGGTNVERMKDRARGKRETDGPE